MNTELSVPTDPPEADTRSTSQARSPRSTGDTASSMNSGRDHTPAKRPRGGCGLRHDLAEWEEIQQENAPPVSH
jgi:hypothetical protein